MLLTVVAICALVLAYVALVAAWLALRTLGRLRRAGGIRPSSSTALSRSLDDVRADLAGTQADLASTRLELDSTRLDLDSTRRQSMARSRSGSRDVAAALDLLRADHVRSVQRLALVRYDAFGDHGGRLSFSLALLDGGGDGVVLTSIAGRTETRLYAKGVHDGAGEQDLSPEETQAVRAALRPAEARAS